MKNRNRLTVRCWVISYKLDDISLIKDEFKKKRSKNGQIDTWTNGCDMQFFFFKFHQLITGGAFLFDERNVIDVIVANRPDND